MQTIQQLYDKLGDGEILHSHTGNISVDDINKIIKEVELKIKGVISDKKIIKRVNSLYIEVIQNLYHHIYKDPVTGEQKCIIMLTYKDSEFGIITFNLLVNAERILLSNHIDYINSLTVSELKHFYINKLAECGFSAKGGGGLGLIIMAKKSQNKLEYILEKVNSEVSATGIKVKI